jgi:hypothetical protein
MKLRPLARFAPALPVLGLLLVALIAPSGKVSAGRGAPELDFYYYPTCTSVTQGGIGDSTSLVIAPGEGLTQPLGEASNIASCILSIQPADWSGVHINVSYWDPATLAPSAGQLAVRTLSFPPTTYAQFKDASRIDLFPPLITRALTNVAEPPPPQVVAQWRVDANSQNGRLSTIVLDDASEQPSALKIGIDGTQTPIAGPHPVFVHEICGGDAELQSMRVVQSVMSANVGLDPAVDEYVQKFRIPVETSLRWIEVAFAPYSTPYVGIGRMRIVDAAGQTDPPTTFDPALADAQLVAYGIQAPGEWRTHGDFSSYPSFPTLQPNHDYWLVVNPIGAFEPFSKVLNGGESPYFKTAIGSLYVRSTSGGVATPIPNRALSFRVIGTPTGTVDVGAGAPARDAFALRVAPNPARGATSIAWTGARGAVALEVLDARGRRVASANLAGDRWSWEGRAADGRSLPAGVYFVRARDAAGRSASTRISLVR